jgi:hypothetical protein
VSIEYYTRLERGNLSGVSEAVLDSLVAALQLDESERAYLFDLAKGASAPSTPRRPRKATGQKVRPNWSDSADTSVSILRTEAGRNPYDKGLTDLVGSCPRAPRSSAPAGPRTTSGGRRSAAKLRRVRAARRAGLTLTAYSAEPGTRSADNLALLVRWAATNVEAVPA